ncbi:nonribosomal peptide synthetase-like protein [Plectosphaerella plurivora]|uniref:Nonribosomal peptide synthetase-like protein n=1 Tax=Plectosphaerella plurivora TaxID=936078 RepID=A0A9P8V2S9_9PEZI|nr:nonribosomal peptide synthetase-like protein [Plectosphaerella plurivora]
MDISSRGAFGQKAEGGQGHQQHERQQTEFHSDDDRDHDLSHDHSHDDHDRGHDRDSHDNDLPAAKQRKPPHVRSRASRACDRCKARKTRCSGKYPCALCSRLNLDCRYTASYRRGRLPSIEMDTGEDAPGQLAHAPRATEQQLRGERQAQQQQQQDAAAAAAADDHIPSPISIGNRSLAPADAARGPSTTYSSRNSPEPVQTDQQGHYVGPASGASFLLRVQRKLQSQPTAFSSDSSIFTFGDLPLPELDPRFLILPPRPEAESLLRRYFEFGSATHRFLHRPTVERWLEELYDTSGTMREQTSARSRTALLFMVFAHAENYPKSKAGTIDATPSARFFAAAEEQLAAEKGSIRLTSVQARLAQCFYLLSHSRINHCWSLFGTTAHLMLALGIHRRSPRVDPAAAAHGGGVDLADIECRKRTFWCAYNLDTYLSAALGRPRTFHDDDIDQEMPLCVDDYRLDRGQTIATPAGSFQLSRIVANILRDLYGIRPPSTENQFKLAARYAGDIDAWRSGVAYLVDTDGVDPSLFQPIFARQRNVLNMACWHAQLLVHRPFLLNNFASLANLGTTRQSRSGRNADLVDEHVQRCLEAAMSIVGLVDDLDSGGQLYNTFWFSHYFAFCAVVMLYLYAIQRRHSPPETYLPAFNAATRCQAQITSIALPGSLAQRYGLVLQELRLELLRHNSHLLALATGQIQGQGQGQGGPGVVGAVGGHGLLMDEAVVGRFSADLLALEADGGAGGLGFAGAGGLPLDDGGLFPDASPGSSIAQLTGWGQFDSLALTATTVPVDAVASLGATKHYAEVTVSQPDKIECINDFILHQARNIPDTPLLAYPASELGSSDFADYTAKQLDQFADEAAKDLAAQGLSPFSPKSAKAEVVALLGPSNLDYIVTILALSRMGFAVLFLSTRLPTNAYVNLLRETECTRIVATQKFTSATSLIREEYPLDVYALPEQTVWSRRPTEPRFERRTELIAEEDTVAFIVHSSGSTGLPKPIYQTHRQCLSNYATGSGMRAFVTLPLFHNHGLATMFRGMVTGKRTAVYNANLPLTNGHLVAAMKAADFESFHCVPYALKVLSETDEGVTELAKARLVLFGGSSCPDDLGDMLVARGVNIVSHYGATEMGQLMTSQRDPETDKEWNYVRPLAKTKPYLYFDEIATGIFEVVVLDGLSTKTISNSDDPSPNSYRLRDTFVKHPTLPDAWKYLGRLDDRVLPIPFEHTVRQSELVQDCLVFGVGRAFPGLLGRSAEDLLDTLWPVIQSANERAEQFGRVSKEMVKVLEPGTEYPRTDKGTHFEKIIDDVYERFETPGNEDRLALDVPGLQEYLTTLFAERVAVPGLTADADFFSAGMDSLQAITARANIVRELDIGGASLGQNVVFEHPSITQLAAYLHSLRVGEALQEKTEEEHMTELVAKYTNFTPFVGGREVPDGEVVVLTGATGSLGAHVLAQLLDLPHVRHVYCLERVLDAAHSSLIAALAADGLPASHHSARFTALPADLSRADLGLAAPVFEALRSSVTSVRSFESQHIAGLRNLLDLCLAVPFSRPARFAFISSISAAAGTPSPASIAETLVADPAHAQNMGYARSKWVAEHIVASAAAATGIDARVLRSGQIIGDSIDGRWNATEAIPLMFRAAITLGALPALDENPSWLPVDRSARSVLEISGLDRPAGYFAFRDEPGTVYHLQNPHTVRWTEDVLPALAAAGLDFEVVPQREWVRRLREGDQDPVANPTVKLTDFFAEKYDNDRPGRSGLVFETRRTEERSRAIGEGYDVVTSGLLAKCVNSWKKYDW